MVFKKVASQVDFPKMEEEILDFWDKEKIFEQSVQKDSPQGDFIFYEGPPTANGKPGLHHILSRSFKDIIPRYKTMRGYHVERKAGWDTHGLPVELQVEKALGLKNKQDIENIVPGDVRASVIEFNKKCKESVWGYRDLWEKMTKRMGYWVDMEHPYVTYENEYIESVWWQIAQIAEMKNEQGESFLYRGHKVVPYCHRCGTALSSHEVAQGYQTVKDLSVTAKFELVDARGTFVLAWTTTPWTLPGNVALAVGKDITYVTIEKKDDNTKTVIRFILAKDRLATLFPDGEYVVVDEYTGAKLLGKLYIPPFDYYKNDTTLENYNNGWKIYHADFISTDTGTGIAHEAPAFGEEDMELGKKELLPFVQHVGMDGAMKKEVTDFAGLVVKTKDDAQSTDIAIIKYLAHKGLLFAKEKYEHEYPSCWRCDTPLIYYAKPSWFIRMSDIHDALVANNESIKWVPEHIKEGRFGEWLRGVRDWAISRERYWGTPLPLWECEDCNARKVISSIDELTKLSGKTLKDVHKPYIDEVTFACQCGSTMKRTPEVMDVWFDSGAMPLAQFSYPHKVNAGVKKKIEEGEYFPADYICEAIDQTRGWFYTLHAIATLLHKSKGDVIKTGNAYKHVICLGHVLDGEGKKMSKSRGNVVDPFEMFDQFGADQLRWFFFSINQPGLTKRFDLKGMRDVQNRVFRMLWNSYSFFMTYATIDKWEPKDTWKPSEIYLDQWIVSDLHSVVSFVKEKLDVYDVYGAAQAIEMFIDRLSNWYIRLSRDRFWKNENDQDKDDAYATLHYVLVELVKLMAPFTPFISEEIYKNLTGDISVHLAGYPKGGEVDNLITVEMAEVRGTITEGLKQRAEKKIRVRQPLTSVTIREQQISENGKDIIKKELNVKKVLVDLHAKGNVILDTNLTDELKLEGEMNEINRAIQAGRKKANFSVEDRIVLGYQGKEKVFETFASEMSKKVLAVSIEKGILTDAEYTETVSIEGESFTFSLKRI